MGIIESVSQIFALTIQLRYVYVLMVTRNPHTWIGIMEVNRDWAEGWLNTWYNSEWRKSAVSRGIAHHKAASKSTCLKYFAKMTFCWEWSHISSVFSKHTSAVATAVSIRLEAMVCIQPARRSMSSLLYTLRRQEGSAWRRSVIEWRTTLNTLLFTNNERLWNETYSDPLLL